MLNFVQKARSWDGEEKAQVETSAGAFAVDVGSWRQSTSTSCNYPLFRSTHIVTLFDLPIPKISRYSRDVFQLIAKPVNRRAM